MDAISRVEVVFFYFFMSTKVKFTVLSVSMPADKSMFQNKFAHKVFEVSVGSRDVSGLRKSIIEVAIPHSSFGSITKAFLSAESFI